MAGKKKVSSNPPAPPSPEILTQVASIKAAADKEFLGKNFIGAVEQYETAAKLLNADVPEKLDLLQKSANCYLLAKKYKEAVKTCTTVLDQQPTSAGALKTRSKAYEALGFFKQALSDAQNLIQTGDAVSEETLAMERRLKDVISANKAKLSNSDASSPKNPAPQNSFPYMVTVKATLGEDTRLLHASIMVSYYELYEAIKAKFPGSGPIVLKYQDKEGAMVTMTCRNDVQTYLTELVTQFQKQAGPRLNNQLPPMRIQVVKVSSEAEVPRPPADELPPRPEAAKDGKVEQQAQQELEVDDWLMDFIRAFQEITGIDPAAQSEHINMASEKLTRAVEATLSDEKAQPLFDQASEHFRDATASSLVQWGNVNIVKADRQAQQLLKAGKAVEGKALDAMLKEYDECEKKYNDALKYKADSWEAEASLAQLEWERCKAKLGYLVPSPSVEEAKALADAEAAKEQVSQAVKSALAKIDVKKVGQGSKHIDSVTKLFEKALVMAKADDERKKKREEERKAEDAKKSDALVPPEPELTEEQKRQLQIASAAGNVLIMHGNILYEWSQVLAAVGKEWKPVLDLGVSKFRAAGAAEPDIRAALKNHTQKDQLDLGPDPEPPATPSAMEAPKETEAKADDKMKAPEAKGLPSLEVKKKNKA
ncbi:hypothetical protein CEUSTIGMA_g2816.t1 [Chlamydomonas eustigma]|uniref:PB1 domain-containing protein n=1 Tax=Chlamydomonas eustigma TaxID=1157962 RepID=A0A250WXM3_9CHLO|nr:hypothetical protein CEUSTIGMA_g2816.t1 [Chlamydomonas eustigma]|eukprot:GAX75372.1 hypothetical protein CEUSTIGMA_g2816.t1 [Chlamydomonas eustigma]